MSNIDLTWRKLREYIDSMENVDVPVHIFDYATGEEHEASILELNVDKDQWEPYITFGMNNEES